MIVGVVNAFFASRATVTPKELAAHLYGPHDPHAYHKALTQCERAVQRGHARKVCAGVYQRTEWRTTQETLPNPCTIKQAAVLLYGDESRREPARQAMLRAGMRPIERGTYARQ